MRPLEGIRVIDLTHVLAGPFSTHQLCMLGADVIKIEKPGQGDQTRGLSLQPELKGMAPGFVALNAGKRSIVLDLKTDEGRRTVEKLVATADVFVENFRPGKAAKLGLTPERLHAIKPTLIYCSISGWGQVGPNASRPAYDHVIQAATGMMLLQGDNPEAPPMKVGFPMIDIGTGMMAANAMLAALLRRARGDLSPIVLDVSMVDASAQLMVGAVANYWLAGIAPRRVGNQGFVGSPGADTFPTADGWISTAANTLRQFQILCRVLDRPDILTNRELLPKLPSSPDGFLSDLNNKALRDELVKAFATERAVVWEERLAAAGVPASMVQTVPSYLDGHYVQSGRVDSELEAHPLGRSTSARILNEGFRWTGEARSRPRHAPRLGEHTAAILEELSQSA
ncbi:CoA transferase [Bradyrhizobium sp. LHD-71]|uniref:CaiB/BaiF CoA transferase family protein n=1 Tax=Bradyrhizobium sp. LHD-71 TaxID=3072141 RepID=UPI00280DBE3F|nr:CoA transferase [Bradyrhizobium sp. LHD-71]MDQ8728063.1 CoA transferase [Bradyrhizobium sp. LHD-71]